MQLGLRRSSSRSQKVTYMYSGCKMAEISDKCDEAVGSAATTPSVHPLASQEYDTQYLNFTPKSFFDGLYNAFVDYTWECFSASQKYIKDEFSDSLKQGELQRASEVYLSKVSSAIDKAFDKLEGYLLNKVMCVPSDLILPEDQVQEDYKHFSKEHVKQLDTDVQKLKDRIIAAKYLNASLKQEIKLVDQTQKEFDQFLEMLRAMDKIIKEAGVSDVRESLVFAVEKSNKVIDILREIHTSSSNKRSLPSSVDLHQLEKKIKPSD